MCERLTVDCVCGDSVSLDSPVTGSGRDSCPALLSCPRAKSCGGFPLQAEDKVVSLSTGAEEHTGNVYSLGQALVTAKQYHRAATIKQSLRVFKMQPCRLIVEESYEKAGNENDKQEVAGEPKVNDKEKETAMAR